MNIKTPFGDLFYLSVNGVLQKISWQPIVSGERNIELEMQVTAFFNRELKLFFLPLKLDVPAFSQKVLIAAQSIPFGQVMTYSEIAQMIDEAGKARAVANALKHNPYALV
ncbi:MAG: MGMT family protein, partial [Streptococcaceae bacterium]|nr:MGMT family protein [Streptococcaceae bacterium]